MLLHARLLQKQKLKQLRNALESAPTGASGFGGSCSVYDKKTKRVSLVEFKSKQDALDILDRAEKGNVDIIIKRIQEEIVLFAAQRGIKVPREFWCDGEIYNGLQAGYYFAALDWLAYPLVREISSPALCRNLTHADRNAIAPVFNPLNFKQLVEHYYGTSTSKLLEEIWKVIAVGGEYKRTKFPDPATAIGKFADIKRSRGVEGWAMSYAGSPSKALVDDFSCLLKSVSPKKLLSALFSDTIKGCPDLHSLKDTANMLREYDSYERIPKTLRLQYPTGLVVDFKFKT
ncbi:unnamed protein product [Sphagnum balticum]